MLNSFNITFKLKQNMKRKVLLLTMLLFATLLVTAQNKRYAKPGATGGGTSWSDASGDIQKLMDDLAALGGGEVWISAGVYVPLHRLAGTAGDQNKTFLLRSGVKLYGGFAGNETALSQRNYVKNPTVFSAKTGFILSCLHVMLASEVKDVVVDGVTVSAGNSNINAPTTIVVNGHKIFTNSGGGLYSVASTVKLENVIMQENTSFHGAGIFVEGGKVSLVNAVVCKNASLVEGAGIYCINGELNIDNSLIDANASIKLGGGIYCVGSTVTINDSKIFANAATVSGGGIGCYKSTLNVNSSKIQANKVSNDGGGVSVVESTVTFKNVLVAQNTAKDNGGGMHCITSSAVNLINSTVAHNHADGYGGGVYNIDNGLKFDIRNSIIWGNTASMHSGTIASQNIFGTGVTYSYSLAEDMNGTPGIILDADPQFDDEYNLTENSPARSKGNNEHYKEAGNIEKDHDPAGNPRLQGSTIDLGAYEYPASITHIDGTETDTQGGKSVWSYDGKLYVKTDKPAQVEVYNLAGILVEKTKVGEGENILQLLQGGMYIVVLDGKPCKILVNNQ